MPLPRHTGHSGPKQDANRTDSSNPISFLWDRLIILTFLGILTLDQVTKVLVSSNLRLGESWPADGWVRITYGTNSGSAFGFFPNQTVLLLVLSILAIGFLVYFYRTQLPSLPVFRVAIGLQLGGAFGNLIDRIRLGSVVDFVDVGPWPIFNVADSSVLIGIGVLAFMIILGGDAVWRSGDGLEIEGGAPKGDTN